METILWIRLAFIGGIVAVAALAVAAELLIDRLTRGPASRVLSGRGASPAPVGGRP